ncbi:MAG: hypothetical protein XD98_0079 [Microgenomates bacterium 39_6]|nr:MAG: hypothetical protein XD98_0079 [Microgenomates bacterium 39_6]
MKQNKDNAHHRYRSLLVFLSFATVSLIIAQVLAFIFFNSQAESLTKINQEKERLSLENHQLKKEINQLTSLPVLEERAKKLGFLSPANQGPWSSIIYLTKQTPIASAN